MHINTAPRSRGSILAFVLMALIALLALGVVFFSRSGRMNRNVAPAAETIVPDTATAQEITTAPLTVDDSNSTAASAAPPVMPPPPPPLSATPDPKTMPPEG